MDDCKESIFEAPQESSTQCTYLVIIRSGKHTCLTVFCMHLCLLSNMNWFLYRVTLFFSMWTLNFPLNTVKSCPLSSEISWHCCGRPISYGCLGWLLGSLFLPSGLCVWLYANNTFMFWLLQLCSVFWSHHTFAFFFSPRLLWVFTYLCGSNKIYIAFFYRCEAQTGILIETKLILQITGNIVNTLTVLILPIYVCDMSFHSLWIIFTFSHPYFRVFTVESLHHFG